jgi:hypothetical protein
MPNSAFLSPGTFLNEIDQSFMNPGIGTIGAAFIGNCQKGPAFIPIQVTGFNEFRTVFGNLDPNYYMPYAVQSYLRNAGVATIVRVLGKGGYQSLVTAFISGSRGIACTLRETISGSALMLSVGSASQYRVYVGDRASASNFSLMFGTGSTTNSLYNNLSLFSSDGGYIANILGTSPDGPEYLYVDEIYDYDIATNYTLTTTLGSSSNINVIPLAGSGSLGDFTYDYQEAETPFITSQLFGSSSVYDLFKFYTLAHGEDTNREVKITIQDIKAAVAAASDDYGSFTVVIRDYNDTDKKQLVFESYANCNLNPNSKNYIAKRIGDQYKTYNTDGKLSMNGDFPNRSVFVRVEMADISIVPQSAVPF